MKRLLTFITIMCFAAMSAWAQDSRVTVHGKVVSKTDGEPLLGVTIAEKGTVNGTISDLDGNFTIMCTEGGVITASYVGYQTQELTIPNGGGVLNFVLEEDNIGLDEVVVIGYGVQKKSVVTAAISGINADDIAGTTTRVDNALRGAASGVTVTASSGQPGASSQVRIRGVGTINNSDPLYIVDGMPIDGGIDYLAPSDIQSIEVLKDAASGAVYGARAANGVIIVTTKKGKTGKPVVTYDFSQGFQNTTKTRDVLNAVEYATIWNEFLVNSGLEPKFDIEAIKASGIDTDWQRRLWNYNAPVQNHQLSVSGANERVNYYFSAGYYNQEGIIGGDFDRSNYKRFNFRTNNVFTLVDAKDRNWLNNVNVGINIAYTHINSKGIETNSEFGSPLGSAMMNPPTIPVYSLDPDADRAAHAGDPWLITDKNGYLYSLVDQYEGEKLQELKNPMAFLSLPDPGNWSDKFVSNFFAEVTIWDNLKFKSSYGADMSFWGNRSATIPHYINTMEKPSVSSATMSWNKGLTWQLENTLSYDKTISGHTFQILLGQSAKKNTGAYLGAYSKYLIAIDYDRLYPDFTTGNAANADERNGWGADNADHTLASLFARVSYDYKSRYMFQATVRRDGSSNFGPQNHYATFPSFSVGWNITRESFLENRPRWWNNTKLRYSWGKNGNENIGAFAYTVNTSTGHINNYFFGLEGSEISTGAKASGIPNYAIQWEENIQHDAGIDFDLFNSALSISVDWYKKVTDGMLQVQPIVTYVGEAKPTGNVGKMENKGWEFDASYRWKIRDANFRFSFNAAYLQNKLVDYGTESGENDVESMSAAGYGVIAHAKNGEPYPYFYGYQTAGVFQNQAEIEASGLKYGDASPKPGDLIFVDQNGDDVIDDADNTKIGKGMPDWTFGFSLTADWKGFDFVAQFQGVTGVEVYDATRRNDLSFINLPTSIKDRWTGEGTSTTVPKFYNSDYNNHSSDFFVHDGSYLRLRNIELGYTLPQTLTSKAFISKARVFVSCQNLFTLTKYEGFDPEIGQSTTAIGIDKGIYPQARTLTFGVNVAF